MSTEQREKHEFVIWESADKKRYWWVYYDGNYEALVTSETFPRLANAQRSLGNFKEEMKNYFK